MADIHRDDIKRIETYVAQLEEAIQDLDAELAGCTDEDVKVRIQLSVQKLKNQCLKAQLDYFKDRSKHYEKSYNAILRS